VAVANALQLQATHVAPVILGCFWLILCYTHVHQWLKFLFVLSQFTRLTDGHFACGWDCPYIDAAR